MPRFAHKIQLGTNYVNTKCLLKDLKFNFLSTIDSLIFENTLAGLLTFRQIKSCRKITIFAPKLESCTKITLVV